MNITKPEERAALLATVRSTPRVKLTGENGNAFHIMALCRTAAIKAGWEAEQIDALLKEMTAGDYDHLLATAARYLNVS